MSAERFGFKNFIINQLNIRRLFIENCIAERISSLLTGKLNSNLFYKKIQNIMMSIK